MTRLIIGLFIFFIFSLLSENSALAQTPSPRQLKYYGVDRGNPINESNYSELSKHSVSTIIVDTNINGSTSEWQSMINLAEKYNFNIVIWPSDWSSTNWPNCGWEPPYAKNRPDDYIVKVKPLLDIVGGNPRVIGIVNAHEPFWSCIMTIDEMAAIKNQLKDYVRIKHGREIQVWNYIDNIADRNGLQPADIGKIMDVAVTWQHCFGGAEGSCPQAKQKVINDRNIINSAGLNGKVDLVYLFQTFSQGSGYRMPTASEMTDWSCQFLNTNTLDGFLYYTWGACWYNSDLYCPVSSHPNQNLWPEMNNVFNNCVNKTAFSPSPTITQTISLSPRKPADANSDGKIDGLDYVIWVNNYNKTVTNGSQNGDFNLSGNVDGLDYVIWLNNYNK